MKLVLAHDQATEETLVPLWEASNAWDRHRLAEIEEEKQGRTYTTDDENWHLRNTLDAVRLRAPQVLRAVGDVASVPRTADEALIRTGLDEALIRTGLVERVVRLGAGVPLYTGPGPTRAELLAAAGVPEEQPQAGE
ncbi:hypothetical protein [Streptomyces adelaidensis]|uniref:hypothetical protein n=1 Tax=Streptomyces adelaidensis TaxID=2796465 RepID=UPI00190706C4|nr:hypothetical protein [Streptomyces adelaidensis]